MNIAIIEDEQEYADVLVEYSTRFGQESNVDMQCSHYKNGVDFISSYHPVYDLLLLDIEMPLMDGLTLARKIREIDPNVIIIFITKMAQYAMAGYEVSALDYLLKPINYYAFSMKMRRVLNLLQSRPVDYLIVRGNSFVRKVAVNTIWYIDVLGHTITYHTTQGIISSAGSKSIKALENKLSSNGFVRCRQCFLVNLQYVQSVEKDTVTLTNGEYLIISRNRRKMFMQALLEYWGR